MNRRQLMTMAAVAVLLAPLPAYADEVKDLVEDLRELGFVDIQTTTSLLGRTQIRATSPRWVREIVVNPRTGEVLRDVWYDATGRAIAPPQEYTSGEDGKGHGGKASDDDDADSGDSGGGRGDSGDD